MTPEQPYFPPPSHNMDTIWRCKKLLVMTKDASLPNRCVKCNAPAEERLKRKLQWHHPALYLLILASILVYAVVALVVRKTAVVNLALCKEHRESRRLSMIITVLLALIAILCCYAGLQFEIPILVLASFGLVLASAIYGAITIRVVAPTKIDEHFVWLKGVDASYLQAFPELPLTPARYR
jgi:hypothetical protein